MSLQVGQLIYTSLPNLGFKAIASRQIPAEVEEAFQQQIVHEYWDAYNPPDRDYRAAYLHQLSATQTLFGWLYNDGVDDMGRSHTPYFLSYFIEEKISEKQLATLLSYLEIGPINLTERRYLPTVLELLAIPEPGNYEPARPGVQVPASIQQQSQEHLDAKRLLQFYIPPTPVYQPNLDSGLKQSIILPQPPIFSNQNTQIEIGKKGQINEIINELLSKPIGIQGAAIISVLCDLLIPPIGIEEHRAMLLSERLLYLREYTQKELHWEEIDHITIRAQEGHVIFTRFDSDYFLLVQAGKSLVGLLKGEINRTIKQLQSLNHH